MLEQALRDFGLTANEARAYIALLRYGRQSPAELAPRAGVSRGRIYQVLGEMVRKGLAVRVPGRTRSFIATEPRVALEAAVARRREEVEEIAELLDSICSSLESLHSPQPSPVPAIEILGRPDQIVHHFQQLEKEAEREILICVKPPYIQRGSNPGEFDALGRGVRCASLYERSILDDPELRAVIHEFAEAGEEIRVVDELPMKMAVFDRHRALMPLASSADPAYPYTSAVVYDHGLASTLALAFDRLWAQAEGLRREP